MYAPIDLIERLIVGEIADYTASLPHPDYLPSAPQIQDELIARVRRVFDDAKQQLQVHPGAAVAVEKCDDATQ